MFRRSTKMTALLVAAASVMSMVPAMAADSTRLGTKDGTIQHAIAFNGKYIYEGYKGDSDKAVYFNAGDKDKELTDYSDYDFTQNGMIQRYADKYILARDNGEDYLVDLTNGNITDDTLSDKLDSTASKLEKALTKTDKYDGATVVADDLNEVATSAKFSEPWYYVDKTDFNGNTNRIFTDANGKYIDSSVLANIYAYSSAKGKVVKVEKFGKTYSDTGLTVNLVAGTQPEVIAQDKDNLYAIVNVAITDSNATEKANGTKSVAEIDWKQLDKDIKGSDDILEVNLNTATITSGTVIQIAGKYYKADAAYNVTAPGTQANPYTFKAGDRNSLKHAITNTVGVGATNSYSNGKLTLTKAGSAVFNGATTGVSYSYTAYKAPMAADDTVVIGGSTFTYKTAPAVAKQFKDLDTLKAEVKKEFTGKSVNTSFIYDGTSKFEAIAVGNTASNVLDNSNGGLETATIFNIGTLESKSTKGDQTTNAWYLQKISKAQGDTDEEAFEPKTVASYQIDNKSLYDNGDASDAYDWLIKDGAVANFENVQVKDGSLYAYKLDDADTVKVYKLNLKQIKEDPINKDTTKEFGTTKLDGYVVQKDGDSDQDFENTNGNAITVDVNGVLWALNDGKIVKFDGKDKTTVYTCDSGLDQLSVYDDKNLIAWNEDDERYTTATEGKKVTQDEAVVVAPPAPVTGWVKGTDGTWTFNDVTGTKMTSKWINYQGSWYYLKADGIMATGWYNDNGTWYYLKSSGAMATGWLNDNGTWYYLNASGAMLANTTVDGYKLGANGAWVK